MRRPTALSLSTVAAGSPVAAAGLSPDSIADDDGRGGALLRSAAPSISERTNAGSRGSSSRQRTGGVDYSTASSSSSSSSLARDVFVLAVAIATIVAVVIYRGGGGSAATTPVFSSSAAPPSRRAQDGGAGGAEISPTAATASLRAAPVLAGIPRSTLPAAFSPPPSQGGRNVTSTTTVSRTGALIQRLVEDFGMAREAYDLDGRTNPTLNDMFVDAAEIRWLAEYDGRPVFVRGHPYLAVGSIGAAYNRTALLEAGITHVVAATPQSRLNFRNDGVTYLHIAIEDKPSSKHDPSLHFDRVGDFIEEARQKGEGGASGGKVLIHCWSGQSRSVTFILAYLMRYHRLALADAFDLVRETRPEAGPNRYFFKRLADLEGTLGLNSTRTLKQRPPVVAPGAVEPSRLKADLHARYGLDYGDAEGDAEGGAAAALLLSRRTEDATMVKWYADNDGSPAFVEGFPFLAVGSIGAAYNEAELKRAGITHVVAVHPRARLNYEHEGIQYLRVGIEDEEDPTARSFPPLPPPAHPSSSKPRDPAALFVAHVPYVAEFIDRARKEEGGGNNKVLVHSWDGTSRSVAFAVAYLMKEEQQQEQEQDRRQWTLAEALERVRRTRPDARPRAHFWNKLEVLERKKSGSTIAVVPR